MTGACDALELIKAARNSLVEHVLPELDGAARHQGLMIGKALAIAARELALSQDALANELDQLRALYGDELIEHQSGSLAEQVHALNRRLARDLRSGDLDGAVEMGLRKLLRARIEAHLQVSNPKFLAKARGDESESE